MCGNLQRFGFAAAVGVTVLFAPAARAGVTFTEITGQYLGIFPFAATEVQFFSVVNGGILSPALLGAPVDDLDVDVTPFLPGSRDVIVTNPMTPGKFVIYGPNPATEQIVWDIDANPARLDTGALAAFGTIQFGMVLDPASPGIPGFPQGDFALSVFTLDYFGLLIADVKLDGEDGVATWPVPPGGTVVFTFTITAVPEPSTLTLATLGLISLGGRWAARRVRRANRSWLTAYLVSPAD